MPPAPPITLIANPAASAVRAGDVEAVAGALRRVGPVQVRRTEDSGHATALARETAAGAGGLVVALGGDGTASEVAAGLLGTDVALAALPGGGTSVFARTLGVGGGPRRAAGALADGLLGGVRPRRIDTGTVDGRPFLFTANLGITATIMRHAATHPELRARLGPAYAVVGIGAALRAVARRDLPVVDVSSGDERLPARAVVVVQNSPVLTYFGPRAVSVCPAAALTSGTLAAATARAGSAREAAGIVARLLTGRPERVVAHPAVSSLDGVAAIEARSADGRPFPVEADGTYFGERTHVRFEAVPASLSVVGLAPAPLIGQSGK